MAFSADSHWLQKELRANEISLEAKIPVHPGLSIDVAHSTNWSNFKFDESGNLLTWEPITIHVDVYCRDTERQSFEVEFDADDFRDRDRCKKQCVKLIS